MFLQEQQAEPCKDSVYKTAYISSRLIYNYFL